MHLEDLNTSLDLVTSSSSIPGVCVHVMSHTKVLPGKVITIIMHLEDLDTSLDLVTSSPSFPGMCACDESYKIFTWKSHRHHHAP